MFCFLLSFRFMDKDIRFSNLRFLLYTFFFTREHSEKVGCLPSFLPLVQHLFLVYRSYGDSFLAS